MNYWVVYVGYLIDYDMDGIYDIYQNIMINNGTKVKLDENRNYLIDTDEDGIWDCSYNTATKQVELLKQNNEYEKSLILSNMGSETPGFELIPVACAFTLVLFWKRKR